MSESREYTTEEIRDMFYEHIWSMIDHWSGVPDRERREVVSGCVFSILAMLDGSNLGLPAFTIITSPCPEDKEYHRKSGENWFPENDVSKLKGNITNVPLHELFHEHEPRLFHEHEPRQ